MYKMYKLLGIISIFAWTACAQPVNKTKKSESNTKNEMNIKPKSSDEYNSLSKEESYVIESKGTEKPYTGKYYDHFESGLYLCKKCDAPLYRSDDKFEAHCGWPAFDDEIEGAVKKETDADGRRTEILCNNCGGHLGHVFTGEGYTDKNTRHCVNSISMKFVSKEELNEMNQQKDKEKQTETAIFASGCFWGTEYFFERADGVISTEVGYIGGHKDNPTYKEVCTGKTGHAEATRVTYDPTKTSYEEMCKLFFETHDPTQMNRQGPDIGTQYRTGVFYKNEEQKEIAEKLKGILEEKGMKVATEITEATTFWPAEDYHQQYYTNKGSTPYCHSYTKRFD